MSRGYKTSEQKLVDIAFQLVATAGFNLDWFSKQTQEQRMEWVAQQLAGCGFHTTPVGASWGVLCAAPPEKDGIQIVEPWRSS